MASAQLQQLANSAGLKILQYIVTSLAVPGALWFGNSILVRLDKIEAAIAAATTQYATSELRMRTLEQGAQESREQRMDLRERTIRLEGRVDRLEERSKR